MGRIPKGRILVKMDETKTLSNGIILAFKTTRDNIGTVVQSGIETVKEGQKVALGNENASLVIIDGKEYISAKEKAIILIYLMNSKKSKRNCLY